MIKILAIFLLSIIASCDFNDDVKTVYLAYCSDYKRDYFSCPREKIDVTKKEHKIFLDKQFVVVKSENFVYQLGGCSIFDQNNRQCIENKNEMISVKDGVYFNSLSMIMNTIGKSQL